MSNPRPLHQIAAEISKSWGAKIHYTARPYLKAMRYLRTVHDNYDYDSGKSIVIYFLCNAGTWRGDDARRIKAELKLAMVTPRAVTLRCASCDKTVDEVDTQTIDGADICNPCINAANEFGDGELSDAT